MDHNLQISTRATTEDLKNGLLTNLKVPEDSAKSLCEC